MVDTIIDDLLRAPTDDSNPTNEGKEVITVDVSDDDAGDKKPAAKPSKKDSNDEKKKHATKKRKQSMILQPRRLSPPRKAKAAAAAAAAANTMATNPAAAKAQKSLGKGTTPPSAKLVGNKRRKIIRKSPLSLKAVIGESNDDDKGDDD